MWRTNSKNKIYKCHNNLRKNKLKNKIKYKQKIKKTTCNEKKNNHKTKKQNNVKMANTLYCLIIHT